MPTYAENKCVAEFSLPAWSRLSAVCSVPPEETLQRIIPSAWHVVRAERNVSQGCVRVIFDNTEPLWTHTEFDPLPCVGRFGTCGDESLVVTYAARDLHDALQKLFAGQQENRGPLNGA